MRKYSADSIFTNSGSPIPNGTVVVNEKGLIVDVLSHRDYSDITILDGVLCPGFINTHTHLELSYLNEKIEPHQGLIHFIEKLQAIRNSFEEDVILKSMQHADHMMFKNGIVAVADICNTLLSLSVKEKSPLFYHNFIELYGFKAGHAEITLVDGLRKKAVFQTAGLPASITPHAPYSTSIELIEKIAKQPKEVLFSMHNQESAGEDEMFKEKKGIFIDLLHRFGIDPTPWKNSGKSSLKTYLPIFPSEKNMILVHNTYTPEEDVVWATQTHSNLYWCLCPKANLYLENKIPDILMLMNQNAKITIGTDSLASNNELCIWSELKTIHQKYPQIPLDQLVLWATLNGANALNINRWAGSIEKDKAPGLNLIQGISFGKNGVSLEKSTIQKIM